jgi:omega-6 fatty acid desaturase (delta-12 desaturase)
MRTERELLHATKAFAQEDRWRSWWHLASTALVLAGLLALTCLDMSWMLRLPCSLLAGLVMVRLFVIYHDHVHGAILHDSWLARGIFNLYGMLTLTPRTGWKDSHDYHHHHNGQYFGTNLGTFPLMSTEEYAKASRWKRFEYRAVRHPLTILFGYFTIFLYSMCIKDVMAGPRRHFDAVAALVIQAVLVVGLAVFAPSALLFTYLIPVMLGGALGSYLFYAQHNFPGARYCDQPGWNYVSAALHSSSYLKLNPVMRWFTANIGYHHVHHLNSRIPFYRLPEAMAAIEELQTPVTTSLHPLAIYRCLRLKLWDPDRQRMVAIGE